MNYSSKEPVNNNISRFNVSMIRKCSGGGVPPNFLILDTSDEYPLQLCPDSVIMS